MRQVFTAAWSLVDRATIKQAGERMSWVCFVCDEIFYDEVYPWGDVFCCLSCHVELMDVRLSEEE